MAEALMHAHSVYRAWLSQKGGMGGYYERPEAKALRIAAEERERQSRLNQIRGNDAVAIFIDSMVKTSSDRKSIEESWNELCLLFGRYLDEYLAACPIPQHANAASLLCPGERHTAPKSVICPISRPDCIAWGKRMAARVDGAEATAKAATAAQAVAVNARIAAVDALSGSTSKIAELEEAVAWRENLLDARKIRIAGLKDELAACIVQRDAALKDHAAVRSEYESLKKDKEIRALVDARKRLHSKTEEISSLRKRVDDLESHLGILAKTIGLEKRRADLNRTLLAAMILQSEVYGAKAFKLPFATLDDTGNYYISTLFKKKDAETIVQLCPLPTDKDGNPVPTKDNLRATED